MKKFILLTAVLALLLCGCGAKTPVATEPAPTEVEEVTEIPQETEAVVEQTEEVTEPVVLTVEDVLSKTYPSLFGEGQYCTHIPKLVLGEAELPVNSKIYSEHMRKLHENTQNEQPSVSAVYAVGEGNGITSVITCFSHQDYEMAEYTVFHVNTASGSQVSDNQLLAAFGYTPDTFKTKVRSVMERLYEAEYASTRDALGEEGYRQGLQEQLSEEFLSTAMPFIDANGQLCFVVKFYSFAGAGYYYSRICLENPAVYPAPQSITCTAHS